MIPPLDPWHWRSHPLNRRTGSDVFQTLFRPQYLPRGGDQTIATLLESPGWPEAQRAPGTRSALARYSICAGPPRRINGMLQCWTPGLGNVFPTLNRFLESAHAANLTCPASLPFTGGWLGWLGYDVAWEIEHLPRINPDPLPFPVAYWYVPDCFAVLDHWDQCLWIAATHPTDLAWMEAALADEPQDAIAQRFFPQLSLDAAPLPIHFVSDQAAYEAAVIQAKKHIQAGDIFQANLSLRFSSPVQTDSWSIYRALQQLNPSPFSSYWHTPWGAVISCSPERLVQRHGAIAQTRPIAGTRPRGTTLAHDNSLAQELLDNEKENAEHIMLVDLERNDLGRVCEWGSVYVDELLTIERYSHVMHLVSNIKGAVRSPYTSTDLVRALFPGGTITGCPKVRCMEIIEDLEPVRRSLFYGSCGYLDWRGDLDLNILIRTLLYSWNVGNSADENSTNPAKNNMLNARQEMNVTPRDGLPRQVYGNVWGQIGAGIVADSDPEREWHESWSKAQAQIEALMSVVSYGNVG